jgi:hypothetical protein
MTSNRIPLWIKLAYTFMAGVIVLVYWRDLGPSNFLWFSDIALIGMVPTLWRESRFLASTMAVGVLFLELSWVLDFILGGNLTHIAAYMYTDDTKWYIRFLSGAFHLALPPVLLLMLYRYGYDRRALPTQILIALVVVPVTRLLTEPSKNINWVYGLAEPQNWLPAPLYLVLLLLVLIVGVYLPSHLLFLRFFPKK